MFGTWSGGPEAYTPTVDGFISHWNPNATSGIDGQEGAWVACEGGQRFDLNDVNTGDHPTPSFGAEGLSGLFLAACVPPPDRV